MQIKAGILTLVACLAFAAAAAPASSSWNTALAIADGNTTLAHELTIGQDSLTCSDKSMAVANAIGIACSNPIPNIESEGTWRVMGDAYKYHDLYWGVQVLWVCGDAPGKSGPEAGPAGEVTSAQCFDNWWHMCALGDETGGGITRNLGDGGCHEWTIPTLHDRGQGGPELYWGPFLPDGGIGG